MPRKGWKSVTLRIELHKDIEAAMAKSSIPWKSKADFVSCAVRKFIAERMKTIFLLECGNCGTVNERNYLPQKFLCFECGEGSLTEHYEEKEILKR